jgi:hypothetical protein
MEFIFSMASQLTYLHFKCKVFLHVLYNHDKKRKFDSKSLSWVSGTGDVAGADVGADNFEHQRLNVVVRYALYVAIPYFLVPDLQRFAANAVEDGQETALERVLEHF